jgi:hypothetical protein
MIYAPHSYEEVEIVMKIINASIGWISQSALTQQITR